MAARQETVKGGIQRRNAELQRASFNKEARTIRAILSTENPVRTNVGWRTVNEVLTHDEVSCDLTFARQGAPILKQHDPHDVIGVMDSIAFNGRQLEAVIRFSKSADGERNMQDVEDGILRWMSIGYRVYKYEVDEDEENYRATEWKLLEASIVAIPADPSARIQRSDNDTHEILMTRSHINHDAKPTEGGGGAPAILVKEDFTREMDEAREILAVASQYMRTHPKVVDAAEKAIKDKTPIATFYRQAMELVKTAPITDLSAPAIGEGVAPAQRGVKSLGQRFIDSASYKENVKQRQFKKISVDIPEEYQFRATLNAGTEGISGSSGLNIEMVKQFNLLGQQPLYVSDLFAQGTTGNDQIRFIQESTYTQAATRVAEGAGKPEATLDLGVANVTVEKTAVFLNVTEEMLNDWQQSQSFINGRLGYMVQSLEDVQVISGSGSSQIYGILNTTGIQTVSGAANTADAFLRAKAFVEGANGAGFAQPDAFVLNPLDWLSLRISKDSNGQYLFGGPGYAPYGVGGYSNVGSMWGLPVVSTTSIAQGTALCGAFKMGAQIFRRAGLTIRSTDSHASLFVSNIVTIVAEQRMALAVYQPNKFCTITSIPGTL